MSIYAHLAEIPLVDNHAHPVMELPGEDFDQVFPTLFCEGDLRPADARHTVHYRRVLRFLADHFEGESESELLAARRHVNLKEFTEELIDKSGTAAILADDGYPDTSPQEFRSYTTADVFPILRLEPIIEALLPEVKRLDALTAKFESRVKAALAGEYVGLKSIAAYRCGLDIAGPDEAESTVSAEFDDIRERFNGRVENRALISYCLHRASDIAADHGAPVQLHTGFGDADAHPEYVNPVYLSEYIESHPDTPVVILHGGYPYVQTAGYVASTFPNSYLDLSLANPFIQHGVEGMFREALETVPSSKLLYGSDAFTTPEMYPMAATRARTDLATVLDNLVADGYYTRDYALEVAEMILRDNAIELYDLPL
jgi:hypothetical protein